MPVEHRTGTAGLPDDWEQEWQVPYAGSSPGKWQPVPKTGQLTIRRTDKVTNLDSYWSGSVWVEGPEIVLSTAIVGVKSTYPWTPSQDLAGETIRFEGWFNGAPAVTHVVFVTYQDLSAGISFG